jgi:hypothetical protein
VVRERLEPFLATARERSTRGVPLHVERQLRAYLDCGILARGFARLLCPGCGFQRLVAFSCKTRVCPSCGARRMEDLADHLVRCVFPTVPVRQWVLSLPHRVRVQAARDHGLASRLLGLLAGAVLGWLRATARQRGVADPLAGSITAVQRFGSALDLNLHFHMLVPDGVFTVAGEGPARFVALGRPTEQDLRSILKRIVEGAVAGAGGEETRGSQGAVSGLSREERRDRSRGRRERSVLDGFSLEASVRVHQNDRAGLERLCRYAVRPPLALHRLARAPDGRLAYRMKRRRGRSRVLVLTPDELLSRFARLVPPPRAHGIRYHGVFAPNSSMRSRIVPGPDRTPVAPAPGPAPPASPPPARRHRVPWAELLRKVFGVDALACPGCEGRLRLVALIASGAVADRILAHLEHLGLDPAAAEARRTPPGGPARAGRDPSAPD